MQFHNVASSSSVGLLSVNFFENTSDLVDASNPDTLPEIKWAAHTIVQTDPKLAYIQSAKYLSEFNRAINLGDITDKIQLLSKARGEKGKTILHVAIERGDLSLVKLIIVLVPDLLKEAAAERVRPLSYAAAEGKEAMIDWLLDPSQLGVSHKGDVNERDERNKTPLHKAVFGGHFPAATKLVLKGADKNAVDDFGLTAADWARYRIYTLDQKIQAPLNPLQKQKFEVMMQEFAPERGVMSIENILIALKKNLPRLG
jgi:hypothetical protein